MKLEGAIAVIATIGRAIARKLAKDGASIMVAARGANQIEVVAAELRAHGRGALPQTDIRHNS